MKRVLLPVIALALAAAGACKKAADATAEKVQPQVAASVAPAVSTRFTETVDAVGVVTPRIGHVASLAAPAPTRVAKVYVAAGARVNVGDPLVEFEQAPFEQAVRSADAALATAQKAAERAQRLADAGVSAKREAEVAASELAAAQANAAAAHLARDRATLRAPIAGVVTRISAVLGANADASQSLVEVADPSALDVALTLSPSDAVRVHTGQGAAVQDGADATGKPIATGRVSDVSASVDTASRGVLARIEISSGAGALRIGQTVFGRITVAEHASAVVVPIESLVPTGEGFKVFVVDDKGIAMSRDVKIGGRSDKGAWVTEGLKAGERVVTKGAYGMDDSAKVIAPGEKPEPAGGDTAANKKAPPADKAAAAADKKAPAAGKKP
jgi:membrane fusion protein, heavy metal efflux system